MPTCQNLYNCSPEEQIPAAIQTISNPLELVNSNIYSILSELNYFFLANCIFYTLVFMIGFYYFRVKMTRNRLPYEVRGVRHIQFAIRMWSRYVIALFVLALASIFRGQIVGLIVFGIIFVVYFARAYWQTMRDVFFVLGESFGQLDWKPNWPKSIVESMDKFKIDLSPPTTTKQSKPK